MAAYTSTSPPRVDTQRALEGLASARSKTLALVEYLDDDQLERVHSAIMSPLVWDLAHIAAYEDLWLAHRYGGLPLLRADLATIYDAFETPRSVRGETELLGAADARAYMRDVRERIVAAIDRDGPGDGVLCEMVVRHELQHSETMRQTLAIAGLLCRADEARRGLPLHATHGGEWLTIPAGAFEMGSEAAGFAYDNERPRHVVETGSFLIAREPVTAASWMSFAAEGGYERREWWSPEGWAFKERYGLGVDASIERAHPQAPACHVSFLEAQAFARAREARLPSEAEWEKAATAVLAHANGSSDAAAAGALQDVGRVWEWTASPFGGYPGFVAHPYREYSEVFFGDAYRVLRGGSWATDARVANRRFRNWDLPQRRQIFAGVRLAADPA